MNKQPTLAEALAEMTQSVTPCEETETLPLESLCGRVLAEALHAGADLPGHTQSAMDGYAVHADDRSATGTASYELTGTSWAGRPSDTPVPTGGCARIFTGAVLPPGTNAVIIQEQVEVSGTTVTTSHIPAAGENVRHAGEDVRSGEVLLERGTRIGNEHLGLLVAGGHAGARVIRAPRVACFSNGDELRAPGTTLGPGELYDSNRLVMADAIRECGGQISESACLPDCRDTIRDTLAGAAGTADLIVTSGGASVGDADYLVDVARELGEVRFWKLPIKPGKPVLFGQVAGAWLLALPGNPVSSWVTFRLLVRPLLAHLEGRLLQHPHRISVPLQEAVKKRAGRAEYQRGVLEADATGTVSVRSAGSQDSHRLRVLASANCLIELDAASTGANAGERVAVIPFSALRGPA